MAQSTTRPGIVLLTPSFGALVLLRWTLHFLEIRGGTAFSYAHPHYSRTFKSRALDEPDHKILTRACKHFKLSQIL